MPSSGHPCSSVKLEIDYTDKSYGYSVQFSKRFRVNKPQYHYFIIPLNEN